MRGPQNFQGATLCRISLEDRVPQRHPLRKLRIHVGVRCGREGFAKDDARGDAPPGGETPEPEGAGGVFQRRRHLPNCRA